MKEKTNLHKLFSILLCCVMLLGLCPTIVFADSGDVEINATNFPDDNFRAVVQTYDTDGNGVLSAAEITAVTKIDCYNKGISSLQGIEFFTEITTLNCFSNNLTSLDVTKNTKLVMLDCSSNKLSAIDVSKCKDLWYFDCSNNNLTTLNVSNNLDLGTLDCSNNKLTTINVNSNYDLNFLDIENNHLTSLNLSNNSRIDGINSSGNTYEITLDDSRQFDLSTLPGGFSIAKASDWNGGTVSGNILTANEGVDKVTYDYYTGLTIDDTLVKVTFTLTLPASEPETTPIAIPTAVSGLVYNGSEQTGVAANTGYTLTGNKATNAGTYTATATLESGYEWSDGTTEAKTISWSIAKKAVTAVDFTLTGYEIGNNIVDITPSTTTTGVQIPSGGYGYRYIICTDPNNADSTLLDSGTFAAGTQYYLGVVIKSANDNYHVNGLTKDNLKLNGTTADITEADGDLLIIYFKLPVLTESTHEHSYGEDWQYDSDIHWKECECGDITEEESHTFTWVIDKEATATEKGSKHEECSVCGYAKAAVEIPATGSGTVQQPTQTGDNSNIFLWIALLFLSGAGVFGVAVYSKKRKYSKQ